MGLLKQMQQHRKVEFFDRNTSDVGYEIILKRGYSFDPAGDNRVRFESTLKEAVEAVRWLAEPFDGPYQD